MSTDVALGSDELPLSKPNRFPGPAFPTNQGATRAAVESAVAISCLRATASQAAPSIAAPAPEHFVKFYRDEQVLIDSVVTYVRQGLTQGAAVVIATEAHRQALESRLSADGIATAQLQCNEQLLLLDAQQTLASFMVDDVPDRERFFAQVGAIIATGARRYGQVVAFGEMVALLWKQDLAQAAVALEALWNELARQQPFTLFCAYPMQDCGDEHHIAPFEAVCAHHARVIPVGDTEPSPSLEQQRSLARLQQRALVLEKKLEQEVEIQRKMAHLAAIVDTSDDAIISKTLDSVIQSWNAGAQRLFGWRPRRRSVNRSRSSSRLSACMKSSTSSLRSSAASVSIISRRRG